MRRFAPALFVIVVALVPAWPLLDVGHLSDDWPLIDHVHRNGNGSAWTTSWLGLRSALFHRPFFTQLYAWDLALFGVDPYGAHWHHLLWHLSAVLLVYGIARRLGGDMRAGIGAAMLFAWHPALPGAIGWLPARCGVVAGMTTLAVVFAHLGYRRHRGLWRLMVGVLAGGMSAMTRESGYLALIAPLTIDVTVVTPRPDLRRLSRSHWPYALVGVLALTLRWIALGRLGGGYSDTPSGLDALALQAKPLVDALSWMSVGLPSDFVGESQDARLRGVWILLALFVSTLIAIARGRQGRDWRFARPVLAILALFVAQISLLLVSGATLAPSTGQRWYGALALLTLILGGMAHGSWWRFLLVILLTMSAYGPAFLRSRADLLEGDAATKSVLAAIEREAEALPASTDVFFVSGLTEAHRGHPMLQWGLSSALGPPFRATRPRVPIYPIHPFMNLDAVALEGLAPTWVLHPPVEILALAAGLTPAAANVVSAGPAARIATVDATRLAALLGPAESVRSAMIPGLAGDLLQLIEPLDCVAITARRGLRIPVVVSCARPAKGELFLFLPTVDMRKPIALVAGLNHFDLGPDLEDFLLFRPARTRAFVVLVAYEGRVARLAPLISYDVAP